MVSKIKSFGIQGVDGYIVDVEIFISPSLPSYVLVGLPDASIKESKERVASAIKNCGASFPLGKIVVNLAPADTRKEGVIYDLPIALGILAADGVIDDKSLSEYAFIGELGLNGQIRRVNGVLPILITAAQKGIKKVVIPEGNALEASFIEGVEVYTASNLSEIIAMFSSSYHNLNLGSEPRSQGQGQTFVLPRVETMSFEQIKSKPLPSSLDMKYVKGQYTAKRAMEIAAAGGHNMLLIGPPGSGKTMLAKCFPSILPDLTFSESIESTKIHSIAGTLDPSCGIIVQRPFRTPHHTASLAALAGGGKSAKPGEISLAHNGVLFLDEMPEYPRTSLEMLRQPLEDNKITISRVTSSAEFPACFTLIASMNPCPCGYYGSRAGKCTCTPGSVQKYLSRVSGPLLDRIDLKLQIDHVTYSEISGEVDANAESSADIRMRVQAARDIQRNRFKESSGIFCNAKMTAPQIKKHCKLDSIGEKFLREAFEKLHLSARGYSRILKVARTIADLEGEENIASDHIAEAIGYRTDIKCEY